MSGGSFESSQRTEPVCASRFSSIKNCFKTRASGLARGRGWSRIGHSDKSGYVCIMPSFTRHHQVPIGLPMSGRLARLPGRAVGIAQF